MRGRYAVRPTFHGWVFSGVRFGRAWIPAANLLDGQHPEVREMVLEWADAFSPCSGAGHTMSPEMLALEELDPLAPQPKDGPCS